MKNWRHNLAHMNDNERKVPVIGFRLLGAAEAMRISHEYICDCSPLVIVSIGKAERARSQSMREVYA